MRTSRGEVWLSDYGKPFGREQGGARPAVILNGSLLNSDRMGLTVALPLTSRNRGWPSHVAIRPGDSGLRQKSWVMVEQVRSISTARLRGRIGVIESRELDQISDVLSELLAL
jgi:mRNA interferase MazF